MRARSIKTFVIVFAVMLVWAASAYADKVSIYVTEGSPPAPAPNTEIEVFDENGDKVADGTTDAGGKFKTDLPPGTYTFKAKKGNKTDEQEGEVNGKTRVFLQIEEEDDDEQGAAFIPIEVDSQQRYLITLLPGVDAAQWIADHDLPAEAYYFQTIACPADVQLLSDIGGKRKTATPAGWRARGLRLEPSAFATPVGLSAQGDGRDAARQAGRALADIGDTVSRDVLRVTPTLNYDEFINQIPEDCFGHTIQTPLMGVRFSSFAQQYCNPANGVGSCGVDTCTEWQFPAVAKPSAVTARGPKERNPNIIPIVLTSDSVSGQLQDSSGNGLAGGSLQLRPKDPDISTALDSDPSNDPQRNDGPVVQVRTDDIGNFHVQFYWDDLHLRPRVTFEQSSRESAHLYEQYNFDSSFSGGPIYRDWSQPGDTWIGEGADATQAYDADNWQFRVADKWESFRFDAKLNLTRGF